MNVAYWVKLKKRSTILFFKSNSQIHLIHRFMWCQSVSNGRNEYSMDHCKALVQPKIDQLTSGKTTQCQATCPISG